MTDGIEAILGLRSGGGSVIGAERVALLRMIGETGSISAAAVRLGISYRSAWDAVHALNNLFGRILVSAQTGGAKGGGASLTPAGERVIAGFALMQRETSQSLERLRRGLGDDDLVPVDQLTWGLTMKTSARNVLYCRVSSLHRGAVNCEVSLDFGGVTPLIAMISLQGAEELQLQPGGGAYALINPSFVILARADEIGRASARNCLTGVIVAREDGAVNSELTLAIGDGKTIVASITKESADHLDLQAGDPACALIKASHVILLTPG